MSQTRHPAGAALIVLPDSARTIGEVLPTLSSPLWQRHLIDRRVREEFWRGFWWAAWVGLFVGVWAGWLAAQFRGPHP